MEIKLNGFEGRGSTYTLQHDWPCFVQAGAKGIVYASPTYETAFFEAFPRNPNTFLRGEGTTVKDAEDACWKLYQRWISCPGHEWEACGYENGGGFCKHCHSFSGDVIPGPPCKICQTPTWWSKGTDGSFYCEKCQSHKPLALWTDSDWLMAYWENDIVGDRRTLQELIRSGGE